MCEAQDVGPEEVGRVQGRGQGGLFHHLFGNIKLAGGFIVLRSQTSAYHPYPAFVTMGT